jgi:hypothetical protein
MSSRPQEGRKKKYEKPNLRVHGNVGALTAAVLNTSTNADTGGSGTMTKTH